MSYISSHLHCVFSTKERLPIITPALAGRLWPFLGGIARQNKMKAIEIGGMEDHVHVLNSLPPTKPIANSLQLFIPGGPNYENPTFPEHRPFSSLDKYRSVS